jgi:hypothetical protein
MPLTAALPDSCAVHHQFTSRFTRCALSAIVNRAMVPADAGIQPLLKKIQRKNTGGTMKLRFSLFLLTLALAASSTLTAHARACSNLTIKGTYASTLHGQIFPPDGSAPLTLTGVVKTTNDGKGNFTQVDAVGVNGNVAPGWRPGSGTYSVNADCTGTATIMIPGMPDLHTQFIVSQSGNTTHFVVIDPGVATAGDSERVHTPEE